ncbi:MAG TPA: ribonuclease P protein component [bacterium]|nr:ribonuclease P protein component [bacterium]
MDEVIRNPAHGRPGTRVPRETVIPPPRIRLTKADRIRKSDTFREILSDGRRWHETHMTMVYRAFSRRQVGFAVSKHTGNAVVRNRMKRRMRELFRQRQHEIGPFQIVFLARKGLDRTDFQKLRREFDRFLRGSGVMT